MVVYELECKLCNQCYIGKTQNHFKKRTAQHIYDAWKVLEAARSKYAGDNWRGSGGYGRALKQLKWARLAKGKACSFLLSVRLSGLCGMSQTHPDINRMVDGRPHRTGRSFWHN
eukprot:scaffold2238_cov76-Cyclotella_meneghiniana.AAC.4